MVRETTLARPLTASESKPRMRLKPNRRCNYRGCHTTLSTYNADNFCYTHRPRALLPQLRRPKRVRSAEAKLQRNVELYTMYLQGWTFSKLASHFELSRDHVRRIVLQVERATKKEELCQ